MEKNFVQGLADLVEKGKTVTPAAQPAASNTGPANAWQKAINAKQKNDGLATPEPYAPGATRALDAWQRMLRDSAKGGA